MIPKAFAEPFIANAEWLQARICSGCTNLMCDELQIHDDGTFTPINQRCLNPECEGHTPALTLLKVLQLVTPIWKE